MFHGSLPFIIPCQYDSVVSEAFRQANGYAGNGGLWIMSYPCSPEKYSLPNISIPKFVFYLESALCLGLRFQDPEVSSAFNTVNFPITI